MWSLRRWFNAASVAATGPGFELTVHTVRSLLVTMSRVRQRAGTLEESGSVFLPLIRCRWARQLKRQNIRTFLRQPCPERGSPKDCRI